MEKSLQLKYSKTLKLSNPLIKNVRREDLEEFPLTAESMENYIEEKGYQPIGPLIQYARPYVNENNEIDMELKIILQASNYINNVSEGYEMKPVIRIANCMYCRYTGPENMLKDAYDKMNSIAFEEDIPLKGDKYIIFVENNEEEGYIVVEVFMERND